MSRGRSSSLIAGSIGLVALTLSIMAPAAQADPVLKAGTAADTSGGFCYPSHIVPSYSQQAAGVEPKVNDVFYVSVRMDLSFIGFSCAAEFYSVLADLPPNVSPAIDASATMICRRWGFNAAGQRVNDQRSQGNCPTSVSVNGNGEFSMRPKSSPSLPEVTGSGGSYWFAGIRSPQESQSYDHVQLLVPVKASATMTNQPIDFLVCATGTSCEEVTVPLTVTGGPVDADPPLVSLPGDIQTTAVGARMPFTVNDNAAGSSYYLRIDAATTPNFAAGTRICGAAGPDYFAQSAGPPIVPYSGSVSSEVQWGDLRPSPPCYLVPGTTYYVEVCTTNTTTLATYNCRTKSFETGAVNVTMKMPDVPPFPLTPQAVLKVIGGHPAGTMRAQVKPKSGGSFNDASNPTAVSQGSGDTANATHPFLSSLSPWRTYSVRACFLAGAHQPCSTPIDYTTGHATTGSVSAVTHSSATFSGSPSVPHPALTMHVLASTTDPGAADPREVMQTVATGPVDPNPGPGATDGAATATGLTPETTYYWTACFDNEFAAPSMEDCGEIATFATAAAPDPCVENPSAPGCDPDPCTENPAAPGCDPDPCATTPNLPQCTPDPCDDQPRPAGCDPAPKPVLALGKVKAVKVKRGKSAKLKVPVRNTSSVPAAGAKVCASVAARFKARLRPAGCRSLGTVGPGRSLTAALTVRAPRKARPGVVPVKLKLTWTGGVRTGSSAVTVRK